MVCCLRCKARNGTGPTFHSSLGCAVCGHFCPSVLVPWVRSNHRTLIRRNPLTAERAQSSPLRMNTLTMETEQHHGQDNEFGNGQWADISGYTSSQHQSPIHEYNGFGFTAPTTLPMELSYNRAIPPPFATHQQLQPLLMPQWPSMMTSQSTFTPSILPSAPAPAPVSAAAPSQPVHTTSTPRRTLTDADRRRMCMYHEENPTVKQTEIGGIDNQAMSLNGPESLTLSLSYVWCGEKVLAELRIYGRSDS